MDTNKDKYFEFLERLRKSGVTNMFGAAPYLEAAFDELTENEAREILSEWMKNYKELKDKFGWGQQVTTGHDEEDYTKLFPAGTDEIKISEFINTIKEFNKELLDGVEHIWFVEGCPTVLNYGDKTLFVDVVDGTPFVYEDLIDWCMENGQDYDEVSQKIFDVTNLDKPERIDTIDDEKPVIRDEEVFDDLESGEGE